MKLFSRWSGGVQPPHVGVVAVPTPALRRWRSVHVWLLALLILPAAFFGSATGLRTVHAAPAADTTATTDPTVSSDDTVTTDPMLGSGDTASSGGGVSTESTCISNGTLVYHGGPVQHHPRIYFIFWGPSWSSGSPEVVEILNLFKSLAGGDYNNILTQYCDSNGHIANDPIAMTTQVIYDTTPPPSGMNQSQLLYEARNTVNAQGWVKGLDTQVLVFPQQGTTYDPGYFGGFCGRHSYEPPNVVPYDFPIVYAWVTYGACGYTSNSPAEMAATASHEYAEMVTDPEVNYNPAWYTADLSNPQGEIADRCDHHAHPYDPQNGTGWQVHVSQLWSNWSNNCVQQEGQEYYSPDDSSPYRNHHTVQGDILKEYEGSCGLLGEAGLCRDVLGPPMTEETSIAGGAVSYFGSGCSGTPSGSCAAIYDNYPGAHAIWGHDYFEYLHVGGPGGVLGFPMTDPQYVVGGAISYFAGPCNGWGLDNSCAAIYDSNSGYGTHAIWGDDYLTYYRLGAQTGSLGWPVSDPLYLPGGAVSYFPGGSWACGAYAGPYGSCSALYYSNRIQATHLVQGGIYYRYWHDFGGPTGALSFPVSDEVENNSGLASYFAGGSWACGTNTGSYGSCSAIYYSNSGLGTHLVQGSIYYRYWHDFNTTWGLLGSPISDELSIAGGSVSYFYKAPICDGGGPYGSNGGVYWSSGTGTHEVHGCIFHAYTNVGGPSSKLGFPTSDEYGISNGRRSDFQHGHVWYDNSTGLTHVVYDCDVINTCSV